MELAGQILIAMPGMADPRFERSVVLLCAHSAEGAMGLIVNKPLEELSFSGLLGQLNIPVAPQGRDIRVHFGGPVERGRTAGMGALARTGLFSSLAMPASA